MDKTDSKAGITVRIDKKLRADFNQIAKADGFSPGNLIRNFIIKTVREHEAAK